MARKKARKKARKPAKRRSSAVARRKSSDSRSYRNIPEKSAGSYPKQVGPFKVVKTKVGGKVAYKITGFAKKPAKIVFREDKAAEFMRRRKKELGALANPGKSSSRRRRKNPLALRNNPMSDDQFITAMLRNPVEDFEMDEIFFDDDEF